MGVQSLLNEASQPQPAWGWMGGWVETPENGICGWGRHGLTAPFHPSLTPFFSGFLVFFYIMIASDTTSTRYDTMTR